MRSSTSSARLRVFSLLSVALLLSGVAGCNSSRSAYRFQVAPAQEAQARAAPPDSNATPTPAASVVEASATPAAPPVRAAALARVLRKQLGKPTTLAATQAAASPARSQRFVAAIARNSAKFSPQRPSEVGLGTTVLGVLGLVVLPISLLGLLIWGGPVWAILAGLAALAVLIAYLDPFG